MSVSAPERHPARWNGLGRFNDYGQKKDSHSGAAFNPWDARKLELLLGAWWCVGAEPYLECARRVASGSGVAQ
ncbi:MAG TPA: hypothetical protein PLU30_15955 [Verrucomicrobiae bacterium]|nr:hypothetical protein [Verrucomicrobiae bacterium]